MRTTVTLRLALALALAGVAAVSTLRCPDGTSECPSNATCCVTPDGSWGCCPIGYGTSLSPYISICSNTGYGTSLSPYVPALGMAHFCSQCPRAVPKPSWLTMAPGAPSSQRAGTPHLLSPVTCGDMELGGWLTVTPCPPAAPLRQVTCPDGRSACPDGATCCQLPSAQYGCCPLQNVSASPCPHAAPRGGGGLSPAAVPPRRPCAAATGSTAVPKAPPVTWSAPCAPRCRTRRGLPPVSPQAVCCPDHVHCCPQGYTCDPQGGTCLQGGVRLPWLSKTPARGRAGDVKCDDETSCPDGNTCCRLSSGAWGCCPLEQVGGTGSGEAMAGGPVAPSLGTMGMGSPPAAPHVQDVTPTQDGGDIVGVPCCGQCGTGLGGGHGVLGGGCRMSPSRCVPICPPPKAVCCKDHQHCCPRGYTCNAATQSCEKLLAATPLRFPVPAGPPLSPPRPVATIPADTARACPPGQRCCRSKDGSWARCPFAQGSCCEDGRRCCPAGYRCARGGRECWPQRWDVGGGISSRTLL
uniref:Granulin precursor n=1 Tax=Anas zonorhyncha TaxID=75864 RepID=A0A8B9UCG4_9AVES